MRTPLSGDSLKSSARITVKITKEKLRQHRFDYYVALSPVSRLIFPLDT